MIIQNVDWDSGLSLNESAFFRSCLPRGDGHLRVYAGNLDGGPLGAKAIHDPAFRNRSARAGTSDLFEFIAQKRESGDFFVHIVEVPHRDLRHFVAWSFRIVTQREQRPDLLGFKP